MMSAASYRKYKTKLDLYGIRGMIPKKVPQWKFTAEVRAYANGFKGTFDSLFPEYH